jgi:hypothetical protein
MDDNDKQGLPALVAEDIEWVIPDAIPMQLSPSYPADSLNEYIFT